jgi:hypothetical protein
MQFIQLNIRQSRRLDELLQDRGLGSEVSRTPRPAVTVLIDASAGRYSPEYRDSDMGFRPAVVPSGMKRASEPIELSSRVVFVLEGAAPLESIR